MKYVILLGLFRQPNVVLARRLGQEEGYCHGWWQALLTLFVIFGGWWGL
jgi:hypothetical protein